MIGSDVEAAAALLLKGDVVAFPTETVYGLGALALNPAAVARIFEVKCRPRFDPLIVHTESSTHAFALCQRLPPAAERLAKAFWPGPLTLVLPKRPCVPDIVTAGLSSVAIRVPAHPIAQRLLAAVGEPIAAPSANRFGRVSPTTAAHVLDDLGNDIPLILDGGPCSHGIESTIIALTSDRPRLLRPGSIALEDIQVLVGEIETSVQSSNTPQSPGQFPSHYAPRTPMQPYRPGLEPAAGERVGLLAFGPTHSSGYAHVEVLSLRRDLVEASSNLFAALRRLDAQRLDRIVCEFAPAQGLGNAINDRLWRGCKSLPLTNPNQRSLP